MSRSLLERGKSPLNIFQTAQSNVVNENIYAQAEGIGKPSNSKNERQLNFSLHQSYEIKKCKKKNITTSKVVCVYENFRKTYSLFFSEINAKIANRIPIRVKRSDIVMVFFCLFVLCSQFQVSTVLKGCS